MALDHPQRGCQCPEHVAIRAKGRDYMRSYAARKARGEVHEYHRREDSPRRRLLAKVEIAVRRGVPTSVIMATLDADYETVRGMRQKIAAGD